jgi:hypothetical protein
MGRLNDNVYIFISVNCLGSERFLIIEKLCIAFKIENIMELIKQIFPYANSEIVTTAVVCFFMTLFGLSLGFALIKVQGE